MSTSAGPNIVKDGLVLCLDAGNRDSYPGAGTVLYDISGNNNYGTLINGPAYNSENNGSIILDGSNDYITIFENINMQPSLLTVEMVFKINSNNNTTISAPNTAQYLFFRQNSRTSYFEGYMSGYDEANKSVYIGATGSNGIQYSVGTASNIIQLNNVYILTCVFKQSTMDIYINGVFQNTGIKSNFIDYNSNHTLKIGRSVPTGTSYDACMNGSVYSFRLYNKILSNIEIQQNFNSIRGRFGL